MAQNFRIYDDQVVALKSGDDFVQRGDNFRILTRVLRKQIGDQVELLNGKGLRAALKIKRIESDRILFEVVAEKLESKQKPGLVLIQALPKKKDLLCDVAQKAVEFGVEKILLVQAENSPAGSNYSKLRIKLNKILIEAMRQSGVAFLPEVQFYASLAELENRLVESQNRFLLDEEAETKVPLAIAKANEIVFAVGPEAAWSFNEKKYFKDRQFLPIRILPQVLRFETAAYAAMSIFSVHKYQEAG